MPSKFQKDIRCLESKYLKNHPQMILMHTRSGKHWDSSEHVAVKFKIKVQLLCRLPGC